MNVFNFSRFQSAEFPASFSNYLFGRNREGESEILARLSTAAGATFDLFQDRIEHEIGDRFNKFSRKLTSKLLVRFSEAPSFFPSNI